MQVNIIKMQLECVILKSLADNALMENELAILDEIVKEFSKDGKKAYNCFSELMDTKSYEEHFFLSKLFEITSDDFVKNYLEVQKVANLAPIITQYVENIKLERQNELANYILKQTQNYKVIHFDMDFFQKFQYEAIKDEFLSFKEAEANLQEIDTTQNFATGVEFLDTAFNGGLATGQLVLVSGDYESGKTTLTTQILENMSARFKVAFFCFEFTLKAYIKRRQQQPNPLFRKENLIVITDGYDIKEITENILKLHKQQGIKIFLIDSQMRIENNHSSAISGEEKESEKFETLGKMAHKLDLLIFLIIQTSKADPNSPFKSKKGAHEASIIMHLENVENSKNPLDNHTQKRIVVKKNKQTGKHFKEDIYLNNTTGQFVKDPNHEYKNANYNEREIVMNQGITIIDLESLPNF